jgi:3' terminal RNA ribose 2'-O-methyltransferase Hen1
MSTIAPLSSFLSVALNKAFRTAMNGVSSAREELADSELPLQAVVTVLPMRGGEHVVRQLFEPLGWRVELDVVPAPNGEATSKAYARLRLSGTGRVGALLNHLYVLIPVMDDAKHYWVGDEEIEKLLKRGEGWLDRHPAKELVVRRYLRRRGFLARGAGTARAGDTGRDARCRRPHGR